MCRPLCTGGENAAPPEDCDGPPDFEVLKKSASKKKKPKVPRAGWPAQGIDLQEFDLELINLQIGRRQKLKGRKA